MKVKYRGCEINVFRDNGIIFFGIIDIENNGYEVICDYSYNDTVREHIKALKLVVDEYKDGVME